MLISAPLETDSECDIYEAELWKKNSVKRNVVWLNTKIGRCEDDKCEREF